MAIYVTQFNVFRDTQISQDFFFLENNLREVLHIAENQLGLIDNFNNKCILTYLICHTIWISFDKIIFIQYNKSKTNMRSGYLLFVHSWFYEVWSRSTCNFNQYPCLNNIHLEKVHVLFIWKCLKYGLKECKRAYSDCFTLYMIVWKRQLRFLYSERMGDWDGQSKLNIFYFRYFGSCIRFNKNDIACFFMLA